MEDAILWALSTFDGTWNDVMHSSFSGTSPEYDNGAE